MTLVLQRRGVGGWGDDKQIRGSKDAGPGSIERVWLGEVEERQVGVSGCSGTCQQ